METINKEKKGGGMGEAAPYYNNFISIINKSCAGYCRQGDIYKGGLLKCRNSVLPRHSRSATISTRPLRLDGIGSVR